LIKFDRRRPTVANTFHLSLDVPDLDGAVAFYAELFGRDPAKRKPGYAKFELEDPPVALALQQAERPALSHVGIRVGSTAEVEAASARLQQSGLVTLDERDTSCCYARQDKVWVADPAGNRWEVYTLLADVEDDHDHDHSEAACCTPVAGQPSACCT
jgi:catechol 2,3-dioxygenase-like lactoylglutathione lyase family enzyme